MKRGPLPKHAPSLAVMISYNELAWVCFLLMALLYAGAKLKEKDSITSTSSPSPDSAALGEAANRIVDLSNHLASVSDDDRQNVRAYDALKLQFEREKEESARQARLLATARYQLDTLKSFVSNNVVANSSRPGNSDRHDTESVLRKELLGLKGDFRKVVFVVDISGSMEDSHRWNQAISVINDWLKYLPVEECALITYNERTARFPTNGSFLSLSGDSGALNREALVQKLKGTQASGYTDTLRALKVAYSYQDVDTIVLFTDGSPELPPPNNLRSQSRKNIKEIYAFCEDMTKKGRKVPINTVGLGNYFSADFGEFLLHLSEITGGTFIGR